MPNFKYETIDAAGKTSKGVLEAPPFPRQRRFACGWSVSLLIYLLTPAA